MRRACVRLHAWKEMVMRSSLGLTTALAIAVLFEPAVHAQLTSRLPEVEPVGGWIFTPSFGFGGSWDDNVLLVFTGDDPPSDYASPLSPSLGLDFLGRRTKFSSGYDGSFLFYRTLDELSSSEHLFRTSMEHRINPRLQIFAQESYSRSPTTDALQLAGVPFFRVGSAINSAGGGFESALNKFTTLRGSYTLRNVSFDSDETDLIGGADLQGGYAHEFAVVVNRALSERLTVGGEYDLTRAIVNGDPDVANGQDDRFNLQRGLFTARYVVSPSVNISGGVGIAMIGEGLTHDAQVGPSWQAEIAHRGRYTQISASYLRSYIPSFGFGGTYQNEEWTANLHVPFARNRAYADGSVAWNDNDPLELLQPSLQSAWVSGRLGYRLTRWLRVEGFYTHARQDSQTPGGRLGRNQVGFQIVTSKPIKLH
jgi:hypothetical protein